MEEKTAGAETHHHQHGHYEHGCFFCTTALPLLERLWPAATSDHFRNSRVEFLKGIRSLLDDRIAHLSHKENKGTRVAVE
jgi:hypothetical protein